MDGENVEKRQGKEREKQTELSRVDAGDKTRDPKEQLLSHREQGTKDYGKCQAIHFFSVSKESSPDGINLISCSFPSHHHNK
ncbi:hypothetical protein TNCV_3999541 [Trichonephila clavipes]|nr:hypothetical protein TNCV_3999541 [Trichonephila clavipes]